MQWSEERSSTRQIPLGLYDSRLIRKRIHIVRRDVKNFIKLSQRIGETAECGIRIRVIRKQLSVARVKSLGFLEVRLAPVPLA